ncbi:MAG: hypothetical protein JWR07_175 [Nevskia sp.]|nr:hypothetical protein [Nevskia sp.]
MRIARITSLGRNNKNAGLKPYAEEKSHSDMRESFPHTS